MIRKQPSSAHAAASPSAPARPRAPIAALLIAVPLCLLLATAGIAAFFGARAGQHEAQVRYTATIAAAIFERFDKGVVLLRQGQYALAQANFEYVLQYQPDNYGARSLLATAIVAQTPTPTPPPTPTPQRLVDKEALFRAAQQAIEAQDWDAAIVQLEQLQSIDPNWQRSDVEALLYRALLTRGLRRIRSTEIEAGLFDLDRAARIQPLPENVLGEKRLAAAYQDALYYFGADWDRAIEKLGALYQAAPSYRDVGSKLLEAYVRAGDALSAAGAWCQAVEKYNGALALAANALVEQKRVDAEARCLSAGVELSATNGVTLVIPNVAGIQGRLFFSRFDAERGIYRYFRYESAQGIAYEIGAGYQPASRPSLSPDRRRVTYALLLNGAWTVVIAPASGGTPTPLIAGNMPSWGSSNLIAFQGCSDACGIHIINPDNPTELRRLTNSANDINMQWSPDGRTLVYTSNVYGSWEIYTVSLGGEFRQLTGFGATSVAPTFSPDGARIAFLSNRDGAWGVWVINSDGSGLVKLIDLGAQFPAWQSERLQWTP